MPLSQTEWAEVLEHTRRRIREAGFEEVDTRVTMDFATTQDSFIDFSRYLANVIKALRERSQYGYNKAYHAVREAIRTEDGQPVEGIEVEFVEGDASLYRVSRLDLSKVDDLGSLISALEKINAILPQI